MGARASQASNRRNPKYPTNLNSLSKPHASKISNLLMSFASGRRNHRHIELSGNCLGHRVSSHHSLLFTTGQIEGSVLDRSSAFLSYPPITIESMHVCHQPTNSNRNTESGEVDCESKRY